MIYDITINLFMTEYTENDNFVNYDDYDNVITVINNINNTNNTNNSCEGLIGLNEITTIIDLGELNENEINIDNIYEYREKYKSQYQTNKYYKFIKNLSTIDRVKILEKKIEEFLNDNILQNESFYEVFVDILSILILNISALIDQEIIKIFDFKLLILLFSQYAEYRESGKKYQHGLENELAKLALLWLYTNETVTKEQYKEVWTSLRKSLITPGSIAEFVLHPLYKSFNDEFASEIVQLYTDHLCTVTKESTELQRNKSLLIDKINFGLLDIDQEKKLKIQDKVDVYNKKYNLWVVGTVKDIIASAVLISFEGLGDNDNEWIKFNDCLIAEYGCITNEKLHNEDDIEACMCEICLVCIDNNLNINVKNNPNPNVSNVIIKKLLLQYGLGINETDITNTLLGKQLKSWYTLDKNSFIVVDGGTYENVEIDSEASDEDESGNENDDEDENEDEDGDENDGNNKYTYTYTITKSKPYTYVMNNV